MRIKTIANMGQQILEADCRHHDLRNINDLEQVACSEAERLRLAFETHTGEPVSRSRFWRPKDSKLIVNPVNDQKERRRRLPSGPQRAALLLAALPDGREFTVAEAQALAAQMLGLSHMTAYQVLGQLRDQKLVTVVSKVGKMLLLKKT